MIVIIEFDRLTPGVNGTNRWSTVEALTLSSGRQSHHRLESRTGIYSRIRWDSQDRSSTTPTQSAGSKQTIESPESSTQKAATTASDNDPDLADPPLTGENPEPSTAVKTRQDLATELSQHSERSLIPDSLGRGPLREECGYLRRLLSRDSVLRY